MPNCGRFQNSFQDIGLKFDQKIAKNDSTFPFLSLKNPSKKIHWSLLVKATKNLGKLEAQVPKYTSKVTIDCQTADKLNF